MCLTGIWHCFNTFLLQLSIIGTSLWWKLGHGDNEQSKYPFPVNYSNHLCWERLDEVDPSQCFLSWLMWWLGGVRIHVLSDQWRGRQMWTRDIIYLLQPGNILNRKTNVMMWLENKILHFIATFSRLIFFCRLPQTLNLIFTIL